MGKFENLKFNFIIRKAKISEREEDFLGRYIVKSRTPVAEFLAVPPRLRSSLLCELAYLRSTTAKERMDVANATPTHAMRGIETCSYILKLINKSYENEDYINHDVLRKAVARRDEIHSEGFSEKLSKDEREKIERDYEYALRTKVSIYKQLLDRRNVLNYAKGAPTTGIEEELAVVNGRLALLEEEGIEGYIQELAELTASRNAAREEADRFATERAEQIMAIAEEVRAESVGKGNPVTKGDTPKSTITIDTADDIDTSDLV